jgi:predicted PurR-regulated permease PerM
VAFLLLLFPLISEQTATITAVLPEYYQVLRAWVVNNPNQFITGLKEFLPATLTVIHPVQLTGQEMITSAGQVTGYLSLAARVIFTLIIILVLAFYWTLDGTRIIQSSLLIVSQTQREGISDLISAMESKLGFYMIGQGILCLVISIMALIAYMIIGLPNALVLALIAGVLEAVPMIGPLLGAVPAALVALSIAPGKLVWVVVATIVIQQLENSLLVPRIMKKAVGVNPFVTLLALFAFSSFFGLAGALMAIPMAAIIQLVLNHFVFKPVTVEMEVSEGRDRASRLRYDAQDLIQDLRKQARLKKRGSDLTIQQVEQMMDEIETIATNLDALLAGANQLDAK